jgi:uncharacterized protein (DUF488 family)
MGLLQAHQISVLADVRLIPYSRRNPQFNSEALSRQLAGAGVDYLPCPALGGRRKARLDSRNIGWRNASFRGYADYMQTAPFWQALETLMACAASKQSAIMCAEAVPWRCHRSLIADALVSRGWTVRHILTHTTANPHHLTPFIHIDEHRITYPAPPASDQPPSLF